MDRKIVTPEVEAALSEVMVAYSITPAERVLLTDILVPLIMVATAGWDRKMLVKLLQAASMAIEIVSTHAEANKG